MATKKRAARKTARRATPRRRVTATRRTTRASAKAVVKQVGSIDVGRLGAETVQVAATRGLTVGAVLSQAGFDLNGERVMVNGVPVSNNTAVKPGDLVLILTPKQAGN